MDTPAGANGSVGRRVSLSITVTETGDMLEIVASTVENSAQPLVSGRVIVDARLGELVVIDSLDAAFAASFDKCGARAKAMQSSSAWLIYEVANVIQKWIEAAKTALKQEGESDGIERHAGAVDRTGSEQQAAGEPTP